MPCLFLYGSLEKCPNLFQLDADDFLWFQISVWYLLKQMCDYGIDKNWVSDDNVNNIKPAILEVYKV